MNEQTSADMLKCMIIDDEHLAIQLLRTHISKVSFLELTETYTNPLEALLSITTKPVDLIFLDIQMPQITGIQFMKLLQNRAMVIITSAYQEYAIEGYEHNVVDYLLKPVSFERFYRAVEKVYNLKNPTATLDKSQKFYPETGGYIFVKVETKMIRVELDDILYIEGLKNYVSIFTKTQRIVTLQVMKQLEEILPPNRFVRIHKSFIVALDKINSIERQQIHIKDRLIPIGTTYQEQFFKLLETRKA
ncbi:LytTR family DNA-binding domain-containing protein [Chitinophagaceae bacterium LB-8]|uniref:LytTR family DNA-binding domain-containing protein n=1 Tax=Paraflavisolibacter caeni TaxID=2982496 RepID=A0A9X2XW83_9BACT|nr:LytTR family DNA-binding domain-containing protein [Paraflavisolibacter caeni]MCU7548808.1 LytTR family DNA-binding domain-containing protein [Paraflavisolibacter caeni]